ncbi:leucine--tRNA ligase [Candidatus Kuenenbacteria bacterium CG10_big_fil_rev_8_21_14_0_10_36_11]|uniref:Leucine--tRNA ligase n=1 Tax=Candidatus Kuenenbacteria bacterium CG10_big_fil_rev_8_21_14_0_10_36_11 TaxID=1974618 RepID=A0A2M6WAT5_9BACT|nr:MAG: leucine--tRNA ligase [Candidatus Kuenenbacteria bacterium CG10_big_fil_rev_8_21_14_0_10_36_11]
MEKYNPQIIEKKWQKFWQENKTNFCDFDDETKKKFYNLVMFFYPSGAKIHIGHGYNYTGSDVYGRYKRLKGFNVFEPMGYDAFGLPAENYAIKTGQHPSLTTRANIDFGRIQLKKLGLMYDWEKEIDTSSPEYYKWTQWLFRVLYQAGLAYRKEAPVNWCPSCKTVLANEQVIAGKCERCETEVVQKKLKQWFFKITDYADKLLAGHEKLNWPEKTILMQKNWIGRSEGAEVKFFVIPTEMSEANGVEESLKQATDERSRDFARDDNKLSVFTTRPDTLFGATFMVVAPEHALITNHQSLITNFDEVKKYIEESKNKSDLERTDLNKEKTGIELKGIKAINPVNGKEIPIFVADYVLSNYGTGAIMAVPAHDERDFEFAKKYGLEIIEVVKDVQKHKSTESTRAQKTQACFEGEGVAINSDEFDGLTTAEFKEKIIHWLEEKGLGRKAVNYKLRDWLISRQRYWGAPIPIIYCDNCGEVLVEEKDLPVKLPELENFKPTDDGESPLARSKEFVNVKCPKCGAAAKHCTETMDTFVCSSWYYLRFLNPDLADKPFDKEIIKKWLPVDQYCGGAEHACMHLLYARFITKVLFDQGYINFDEPFLKLNHQGMILAADGGKMSKSKGNVVIPDDYVKKYGADVFRLYVLFLAPFEQGGSWSDQGIVGVKRFLEKVWNLQEKLKSQNSKVKTESQNSKFLVLLNQTIKKVGEDIENFHFNTAISALMILLNEFEKQKEVSIIHYTLYIILLSPFAPHIAEELWSRLGHNKSIFFEKWPEYDSALIQADEFELVVQVNGKVRDKIIVPADISESEATKTAMNLDNVKKWLADKEQKKIIYVKNKLVNIVL